MKLIIDIPEEAQKNIFKVRFLIGGKEDRILQQIIINAIKNGTPLDDVKAEIEKQIERDFAFAETETLKVPCHYGIANGLQNAIRILDNIDKVDMRATDREVEVWEGYHKRTLQPKGTFEKIFNDPEEEEDGI